MAREGWKRPALKTKDQGEKQMGKIKKAEEALAKCREKRKVTVINNYLVWESYLRVLVYCL